MSARQAKRGALLGLFLTGALLFAGLGAWQIDRLSWKSNLIARVDARIHAPPIPAPGASHWSTLDLHDAEYRRVEARGIFLHDRETLIDALTEQGPGYWVVTPLQTDDGVILVNRGFVPPERRARHTRARSQDAAIVRVVGLLRLSEPGGRILRPNDPAHDRWFSRDVAAIARTRRIAEAAPYFIDAEQMPGSPRWPVAGLTVVEFRNAHLAYALTWFALAVSCIAGALILHRDRKARRRESC